MLNMILKFAIMCGVRRKYYIKRMLESVLADVADTFKVVIFGGLATSRQVYVDEACIGTA